MTTDKAALAGLSDAPISAAAEAAKGRKVDGLVLPLQNTTQQPDLVTLTNRSPGRDLRELVETRRKGDANDTRDTIAKIAQLRAQKAKLLGYPEFRCLEAGRPDGQDTGSGVEVHGASGACGHRREPQARRKDIQAVIDTQKGGFKVQPWDWDFYAEQVRKAKYDLDEEAGQAIFRAE